MNPILNEHIIANMNFYQTKCKSLYRGRYLYEDLFQEFYLKFIELPDKKVDELKRLDKLTGAGLYIIRFLFYRRNQNKKNGLPITSLFETAGNLEIFDSFETQELSEQKNKYSDEIAEKLKQTISKYLANEKYELDILYWLQGQEQTLTSIAKESKINRVYVSAGYNRAEKLLKQELQK